MVHCISRRAALVQAAGAVAAGSLAFMTPLQTAQADSIDPSNWMSNVPSTTKLSQLSLPGTHETCARSAPDLITLGWVKCQTLSLPEQLTNGIRFIDIRCRHIDNIFAIHHGAFYQYLTFGPNVRDVCISFLQAHPGECIVMSIKEEYTPSNNTRSFEDTFDSYVQGTENSWYLGESIPTVNDVRGKIVLFRRFDANRTPKGIIASPGWVDNATFQISNQQLPTYLFVQDNYNVPTIFNIPEKEGHIQSLLDQALQDPSNNWWNWYINFTSGTGWGAQPSTVAASINPHLSTALVPLIFNRIGTILMDFPGQGLINRISSLNFHP